MQQKITRTTGKLPIFYRDFLVFLSRPDQLLRAPQTLHAQHACDSLYQLLDLQVRDSEIYRMPAQTIGQQTLPKNSDDGIGVGAGERTGGRVGDVRTCVLLPVDPCGASISFVG